MGARRGRARGRRRDPNGGLGLGRDGLWWRRRGRGGGAGSVPRRRLAGGAGKGCPGLGASVGGEEGGCGLELG